MRRTISAILLILSSMIFAEVFVSFNSSLGFSWYSEVYATDKKQIRAITDYGMDIKFEYGLLRGLRMGVDFSLLNMSIATEIDSVNTNLICMGLSPSFTFDLLDITSQVSGGVSFVLFGPTGSLAGFGLSGTGNFQGWVYHGQVDFLWELSDQFSVGFGFGVRFHDLSIPARNVSVRSLSVPVSLKLGYKF
ncbi:hypothetical protein [Thermotoga profunda]|uniref:hypothetical protein n=1 Tax=Thermotoga profunda TaxID=1508420 RepID=UPI0005976A47|nr:hypothetical protein [Thermotoga profunda]